MNRFCMTSIATLAFAMMVILTGNPAHGAAISWKVGDIDGGSGLIDFSVSTDGQLVEAANFGGAGVPDVTVNSVEFTGVDFVGGQNLTNLVGLTYENSQTGNGATAGGAIDGLIDTIGFDSGVNVQNANLTGLTPGNLYQVEFFVSHVPTATRTLAIQDDLNNTATLSHANPSQFASGVFAADGATQALTFDASTGSQLLSGYQLRDLGRFVATDTVFAVDVNSDNSPTAPGFVGLSATGADGETGTLGGNGDSVSIDGTTFTVFSSQGHRNRGGAGGGNDLTGDFIFDDGANAAVGLRVFDLPDGLYQAEVFSFDGAAAAGNQIVGITEFVPGGETIFSTNFASNPNDPFTFIFDSSAFVNGFGIFTREATNDRSRFNGVRLTLLQTVPEPTTALLALMGVAGLAGRRRREA